MLVELGGFCILCTIWILCHIFHVEEFYTLFFVAFSSSVVSFFLWDYSKHIAKVYQRERRERVKFRRDLALKNDVLSYGGTCSKLPSVLSTESVDEEKRKERSGTKNCLSSVSYDSRIPLINEQHSIPLNSVSRLSPVFPSFCAILLGTLALILYIRIIVNASLAFESS